MRIDSNILPRDTSRGLLGKNTSKNMICKHISREQYKGYYKQQISEAAGKAVARPELDRE